jgi:hypothetical protein
VNLQRVVMTRLRYTGVIYGSVIDRTSLDFVKVIGVACFIESLIERIGAPNCIVHHGGEDVVYTRLNVCFFDAYSLIFA